MTDAYKIVIRCDHVTREGARETPIVAQAHYIGDEWHYNSRANAAVKARSIGAFRQQVQDKRPVDRAAVHAVEVQAPLVENHNGEDVHIGPGPEVDRIVIRCAYPSCSAAVARHREGLDRVMEKARLADIHTLPLSYLRANL